MNLRNIFTICYKYKRSIFQTISIGIIEYNGFECNLDKTCTSEFQFEEHQNIWGLWKTHECLFYSNFTRNYLTTVSTVYVLIIHIKNIRDNSVVLTYVLKRTVHWQSIRGFSCFVITYFTTLMIWKFHWTM
jgi:hypothetical protein